MSGRGATARQQKLKEKQAAEAAAVLKAEQEKQAAEAKKREAAKKKRDAEKKQEEEEERLRRLAQDAERERQEKEEEERKEAEAARERAKEATEAAARKLQEEEARMAEAMDGDTKMDEENTEDPLAAASATGSGKTEDDAVDVDMTNESEEAEGVNSPVRKKKRKEKKKNKKKDESSALRRGRFSLGGEEAGDVKEVTADAKKKERELHLHNHSRIVLDCSIICSNEEIKQRYNEPPLAVRTLLRNMQKVDKWACIEPVEVGEGDQLWEASEIPFDLTDFGVYVMISGGRNAFDKKKARGKKKRQVDEDEDEKVMPEVYFSLAISCDKDPHKIIDRVGGEWGKVGGNKLWVKEISSFTTQTAFCIFFVRNDNTFDVILAELMKILTEAKEAAVEADEDGDYRWTFRDVPSISIRKNVPRVDGMDTSIFQGWSGHQQNKRKCLHGEVEEADVAMIHSLVEEAKRRKIFERYWGRMCRVTIVLDNKRGGAKQDKQRAQQKVDMSAVASYCRKHVSYHTSTRLDGLRGILEIDKKYTFYSVTNPEEAVGEMTLRRLLYTKFLLEDGSAVFQEVHQADPMGAVDVVTPNCEQAERMVLMMNRNFPAYAVNYLTTVSGMDGTFVRKIVKGCTDPALFGAIEECKWEKETLVLTTPEDEENEKLKAMEEAAWYQDEFGEHMFDMSKKEEKKYAGQAELEELNCEHSFKSIHKSPGNYVGSPGAAVIDLGDKTKDSGKEAAGGMLDEAALAKLSQAELIELLKKQHISNSNKGSPPNTSMTTGPDGSQEEDDSSSEGSSSSDSSSSEEEPSPSPSSAGGKSVGRKPVNGE